MSILEIILWIVAIYLGFNLLIFFNQHCCVLLLAYKRRA